MEKASDRLRKIMAECGLKQRDILILAKPYCEKYGVKLSKSDMSQYVNGHSIPSQEKLVVLGKALNVSAAYILGLDEEKHEEAPKRNRLIDYVSYKNLTDTEIDDIINYIQFVISKREM